MKNWMKKFLLGFKYAFCGIVETIKDGRNIKIHILAMIIVILLGIKCKLSNIEWYICIILFSIVIAGEIFNTAIEHIVDLVCKENNELAKKAKDAGAGAVLVLAIGAAVIGCMIFFPKIF